MRAPRGYLDPHPSGSPHPHCRFRWHRVHARGRGFLPGEAFIDPEFPITTPGSVEHSIGTLPSSTESPSRSLKTKELIPPPDGGPQPRTDTPTPCGCGKDPCSLDTGRKSSLSRPQRHPHPTGVGWSFPSDQALRRLRSLRGFSPVVRDLETSVSTIHPLRGFSKPRSYPPPPMGFSPHLSELRKTTSPAGHSRKPVGDSPTISSATPSSYLKAAIQAAK
jgi:hypothetical protein